MIDKPIDKPLKIYQSSAGSGKTYTLVKEYISIVLKSDNLNKFKQILAITFTNKAANEMKERVLEALYDLATSADSKLLKDYSQSIGLSESVIEQKSKDIYKSIIHQYGDFSILTIDKFVHRIIRSFARELDLSLNFEVESDIDTFLQRSVGVLLNNVGTDDELTNYLIRFSEQLIEESGKGDIEKQLIELTSILKNDKDKAPLANYENYNLAFFSDLGKKMKLKESELKKSVSDVVSSFIEILNKQELDIDDFNGKLSKGWGGTINKYLTKNEFSITEATVNQYETDGWYTAKTESLFSPIYDEVKSKMLQLIDLYNEINFVEEFNKHLVGFSLLTSIHKILYKVKTENNIVFIADFNEIISKIVQNESTPFVYEKIGARFKNYLIDEFQDTSNLQWTNLIPLVYDSLSEGNSNLIVGDAKQAIYRWRNGDVQQFVDLPKVKGDFTYLNSINAVFEDAGERKFLSNNFRSAQSIIEFNNWLFSEIAQGENEKVKKIYATSFQNTVKEQEGYVNISMISNEVENSIEQIEKSVLANIIQAKKDKFSNGDIAILVRGKSDGIKIAGFLKEKGYPVVSSDSIVLGSSIDVSFIVSFLLAYGDSYNEHASIKCLDYLKKGSSLTEVYDSWRLTQVNNNYTEGIDIKGFIKDNYQLFDEQYYQTLNLYDKVIYIIQSFGMNDYDPYLDQLLNTIHHYLQRNTSSINLFVEFFEKKKDSITVNLGSVDNAIQVMTIHKSKGLQFPVVIVPFAKWPNKPSNSDLTWIEHEKLNELELPKYISRLTKKSLSKYKLEKVAEIEEEEAILDNINMYYVAFTRAIERLYVIFQPSKGKADVTNKLIDKIKQHQNFNEKESTLTLGTLSGFVSGKREEVKKSKGVELISRRGNLELSLDKNSHLENLNEISEREIGIAVHLILSQVKEKEGIIKLANELERKGLIVSSIKDEVVQLVQSIFELDKVNDWFSVAEVFNEREIISKDGHFYIPDKVVVKEEMAIVIDFKTGKSLAKHRKQITEYGNLLKEIGYPEVEMYLLYINELKIEAV